MTRLRLRRDDWSSQAMIDDDPRFFLRRLAPPGDRHITDILIGNQSPDAAAQLLAEFIDMTGGWPHDALILENIGVQPRGAGGPQDVLNRAARVAGRRIGAVRAFEHRLQKHLELEILNARP